MRLPFSSVESRKWMTRLVRLRLSLSAPNPREWLESPLAWAAVVGFLGALSSVAFRQTLQALEAWVTSSPNLSIEVAAQKLPLWRVVLTPTLGGLIAGLILAWGSRLTAKIAGGDFMEAITLGDGYISIRTTIVKTLSSLITNGTGGSIGREGPMVQCASMLGSLVGRVINLSPARKRLLVACGAAAGIACAYNAPIAGALFVAEVILGSIAMESFGPLVLSSVVATATAHQFLGAKPVYNMPSHIFQEVPSWQLLDYLLLGVAAGLLSPVFLWLIRQSENLFKRSHLPVTLRLGLGGLVVGIISTFDVRVWGNGYGVVESILNSPWTFAALLEILVCKLLATSATTGSGAVGGIFTPTLFCGAVIGSLFAEIQRPLLGSWHIDPPSFAVVGMGCFLAATTRAPIMSIIIMFEMTLTYGAVMPLMLACTAAFNVARQLGGDSMYKNQTEQNASKTNRPFYLMLVGDIMKPDPMALPATASFPKIVATFAAHTFKHIYVVDKQNRLLGAVSLQDLKPFLTDQFVPAVVIAMDLVREIPVLADGDSLQESLVVFSTHDGERLPVVDSHKNRVLVGALSKTDVLLTMAHANKFQEQSEEAEKGKGIFN